MNNKGQTTVLFSLMIGVIVLFTLTALEVGRIHMRTVKIESCAHSMRSSIMADYNEELFERYHLLFMDPTYGTRSEAVLEEKVKDYIEVSLNGDKGNALYQFEVEEIAISEKKTILFDNMELFKQQIEDYEKSVGILVRAKELLSRIKGKRSPIDEALQETEINGVELTVPEAEQEKSQEEKNKTVDDKEVNDPRNVLKESLQLGILSLVAPGKTFSKEEHDFENAPSRQYKEDMEKESDNSFDDIGVLKRLLQDVTDKDMEESLTQHIALSDYVVSNFSNGVNRLDNCVMQCEVEYILKGKATDYDNMEAVASEMTWLRMPVNYAYLLTDVEKKSQALIMATSICVATGTEPLIEIVKYLLVGCWGYGESLQEMRILLDGGKIPYVKTGMSWYTDLESLSAVNQVENQESGLSYEDFLMLLVAKRGGVSLDKEYARVLDVVDMNLRKNDSNFHIADCVGALTIQGKVKMDELFSRGDEDVYSYYFEKTIVYE